MAIVGAAGKPCELSGCRAGGVGLLQPVRERSLDRISALSDRLFAIAMT
jgi:hypothetical protein